MAMDDLSLPLDAETKAAERPGDHKAELRLWLRLLTCTNLFESEIRRRLRETYDVTLPRFDLMAQLERNPAGLKMNELSQRLMVTGGNVTGITDQLEKEGLVVRVSDPTDRRAYTVKLTPAGRWAFAKMAEVHEQWVVDMFAGLNAVEKEQTYRLLAKLKLGLQRPSLVPQNGRGEEKANGR